jgi:hypothetical protein
VIGIKNDDGIFIKAILAKLLQHLPYFPVHDGIIAVHPGNIPPDNWIIRVIGWYFYAVGMDDPWFIFPGPDLGFMAAYEIEDGKERFAIRTVSPVCCPAGFIPGRFGGPELVIFLGIIGAVIPGRPKVFGKAPYIGWRGAFVRGNLKRVRYIFHPAGVCRAHVVSSHAARIHSRDKGIAVGRTDPGNSIHTGEPYAFCSQLIQVRGYGHGISVAAQERAYILADKAKDIGPFVPACWSAAAGEPP